MARRVRFHADFRSDLREHLAWLIEHQDPSWIERLRTGIDEAVDLVSMFPDVGSIEAREQTVVLRRLILRKVPYVVWFVRDASERGGEVWFLRLFHARQDRPPVKAKLPGRRGKPQR